MPLEELAEQVAMALHGEGWDQTDPAYRFVKTIEARKFVAATMLVLQAARA